MNKEKYLLKQVLALVRDWQEKGRNGHCMPVLNGTLLRNLEELSDESIRDNCSWCHSKGIFDDGTTCPHCKSLSRT